MRYRVAGHRATPVAGHRIRADHLVVRSDRLARHSPLDGPSQLPPTYVHDDYFPSTGEPSDTANCLRRWCARQTSAGLLAVSAEMKACTASMALAGIAP